MKKVMEKIELGTKKFGNKIDITDPCYNRDVWCRMNDVTIKAGSYKCVVWIAHETYTMDGKEHPDNRVGVIGIYLNGRVPAQIEMERIGSIGVDAGMAGFFIEKPDYTDDEWTEFCEKLHSGDDYWIWDVGFFSSSGYGDGEYDVFAKKNKAGEIVSLEIRFL